MGCLDTFRNWGSANNVALLLACVRERADGCVCSPGSVLRCFSLRLPHDDAVERIVIHNLCLPACTLSLARRLPSASLVRPTCEHMASTCTKPNDRNQGKQAITLSGCCTRLPNSLLFFSYFILTSSFIFLSRLLTILSH